MAQKKSRNPQDKAAAAAKREQRQARNERAKALAEERRKAAKRRETLTRFGVVGGVLAVVVVVVLLFTVFNKPKDDTAPAGATSDYGLVVGDADAPRSVVIYEDFLCPFCGQLEATVGDQLNEQIEAGDVRVEYRPIPFLSRISDYSPDAANAFAVVLDKAGPDVAKKFHDLLYENQPEESGPYPSTDDIVDLAVEAGATESDVRPGIEDKTFEGWVDAAGNAADDADVNSTPTVIVDGQRVEGANLTMADIAQAILGSGS
ncbi:Thioredoxin [Nocardioides exalbidus]|uniref:Thioredoxin n=2 Tax=Nocardioides exalbidus TaxID=402596 RepID=A0A1H4JKM0_9ACTN|nr:Thioredoxin [Nocardioides exalbidus]